MVGGGGGRLTGETGLGLRLMSKGLERGMAGWRLGKEDKGYAGGGGLRKVDKWSPEGRGGAAVGWGEHLITSQQSSSHA